ncbi:MAG: hypothetical protein WC936_06625 [Candidatus Nanoarchaeia archaeon]|jgi:hypothetical protein
MSEGMAPVIGDIAEIMIGVQYSGILFLIGLGLLATLLLPLPFGKLRAVLGILCILAAAIVFVLLYAGVTLGMMR